MRGGYVYKVCIYIIMSERKYNFEIAPNRRNIGAGKWEGMLKHNPNVNKDVIPYSVADMEFFNAPELMEGLSEYVKQPIYGYTQATENYYGAVVHYMKKYHNWEIKKDWIVPTAGVVPALYHLVSALTSKGDGVILMRPVYYPFTSSIEDNQRKVINVSLIENDGVYTIDFENLEKACQRDDAKLMILCSPHNPIGRVWTKEELERVGQICLDNHVILISDEIHFDFVMKGYKHTVMSTISKEIEHNTIVCTAPSKSFNLGGVQVSNIVIENEEFRNKFNQQLESVGFFGLNTFAYKTCEIVYNECRGWFEELLDVIEENKELVEDFIKEHLPEIKVSPLEGTYLMWLDCRALNLDKKELEKLMLENDLYFDEGYIFGEEGNCFERLNIACPKQQLLHGLERLKKAVDSLK